MSDLIGRQTASYRQGLVLGLTMAEIMLLLVFCLLIAVGVSLSSERAKRDDALLRLRQAETAAAADEAALAAVRRNRQLAELLERAAKLASQREVDDFWRKLVESNDDAHVEQQNVPQALLQEEREDAAKWRTLLSQGIDPDKIARSAALAAAIDAWAADKKLGDPTPQEIVALLDQGLAARLTEDSRKGHNWPPIVNLSEAGGYYFATGSAELTPSFATELRTVVVDRLLEIADSYDVDVIEVIGHTDEQAVNVRGSKSRSGAGRGDGGYQRGGRPAMGRQCRPRARARALGSGAIVSRSAPAQFSHPAALRRSADRHRRPDHPLGFPRRRAGASTDRDKNAKIHLTGAGASTRRRVP